MLLTTVAFAALVTSVYAKTVVVTVGDSTTGNPMDTFQPANVTANQGDVVLFNFTEGNHTATQSTFSSPCIPAHITNQTINGFDSGFRDTDNGTAITTLTFTVTDPNTTVWFYDANTCSQGGVGGININESSTETLDGFQRNAIRLNGTNTTGSSTSGSTSSPTATSTSPAATGTNSAASAANRAVVNGLVAAGPALLALVALSL
ncbi:hypothetical protein HYPSUDRAFT_155068 [Hypholoma sublateritium FD-334 SS-4]|uniref:Phytocyanin domain-containing protein n=1 Tax=Hypholoma sublateritium (strain FD-334 SS-4) TaxID=945553 RepID=A0A0D2QB63_HYPSF|nr:hypothetical protein HYPSUDRAFT_155068 [Hypholoma sublateritium FD-334 SS-4]